MHYTTGTTNAPALQGCVETHISTPVSCRDSRLSPTSPDSVTPSPVSSQSRHVPRNVTFQVLIYSIGRCHKFTDITQVSALGNVR